MTPTTARLLPRRAARALADDPAPPAGLIAVQATNLSKVYGRGANVVHALDDVTVGFQPGSFTAIMGPSGSGKSTLLHCLAGLDQPTTGTVCLAGIHLAGKNETQLTKLRREHVGFIFQSFNLLPALTVQQNIELPARLSGIRPDRGRIDEITARTGLADRRRHRPSQLSGGQQQRVAVARALATNPDVLFGDEPTGALDSRTGRDVLELIRACVVATRLTFVMVTHDPVAAAHADMVLFLADGSIVDELTSPSVDTVAERIARLER
jgi:putative ABC transport system ATP-binding protein